MRGREEIPVLRRLRRKFVVTCMALVTAILAAVMGFLLFSAWKNMERLSSGVLQRAIQETPGKNRKDVGAGQVVLPYFTVNVWPGAAYVTGGTYSELEDTQTLSAIVEACQAREEDEGTLPGYGLRYLRQDNGWYTRIAFVDMSVEIATFRQTFVSGLFAALGALVLIWIASVVLARRAVKPVETAWREQRRFLSDASHELKTPLAVILSNADLLEGADLGERERRWADNIRSESRRMRALVEQMLTLARADSAPAERIQSAVDLSDVAADCALSFEPVAFEAGKSLEYEIARNVSVTGDGEKLREVVGILLDNAVKYGAERGTIRLTLEKAGREARLCVENPGEPIPPEVLSHLFERFYRGDASRGEQSGFGLGLSIADTIVKEHRGTLRAESDRRSTRFTLTLPLKKD